MRTRQRAAVTQTLAPFGTDVDMHWLDDGDVQTLANGSRFHYPLELVDGTIGTRTVRCFSPEVDVLLHWGYPPGATDHSDMAALRDATGVSLPHPFTKGLTHVLARDANRSTRWPWPACTTKRP